MNKKVISTLVIGTLIAGTLAGCGGSSDAGSSAKSSSGKTELELFSTKPENKDTIQKLVDKYNESHDDVTVKVTAPPDAGTVLKTRRIKKRLYMVFHLPQMLPVSSTIQRNLKSLDWKFRRPGMSL